MNRVALVEFFKSLLNKLSRVCAPSFLAVLLRQRKGKYNGAEKSAIQVQKDPSEH